MAIYMMAEEKHLNGIFTGYADLLNCLSPENQHRQNKANITGKCGGKRSPDCIHIRQLPTPKLHNRMVSQVKGHVTHET